MDSAEPTARDIFESELAGGVFSSLDINVFLDQCYQRAIHMAKVRPKTRWRSPLFEFLRLAKSHFDTAEADATGALEILNHWRGERDWDELFPELQDHEDGETEVLDSWEKIKYFAGHGIVEQAVQYAEITPVRPSRLGHLPRYVRFVSIAYHLQASVGGEQTIMLPCELLSSVLGCTPTQVARYRKLALKNGLLQIERVHAYSSGHAHATEFRFIGRVNDEGLVSG